MQYSEKFGFFLPSRDVGDYADINQISHNFRVIDENVPNKNEVEEAIQSSVDQTADSESRKAQSGVAVMQAIQSNTDQVADPSSTRAQSGVAVSQAIDMKTDQVFNRYSPNAQSGVAVKEALDIFASEYVDNAIGASIYSSTDKEYSPTSQNAQSGIAVAEALATISNEKEWELLEDITLTEDVVDLYFDLAKINAKSEIHIEGYVVPKDNTVASQTVAFNDGTVRWSANISCKNGKFFLLMDIYKSPRSVPIFDGSVSVYTYSVSNNASFRMTSINETLSVSDDKLIKGSNFRLRTGNENPMTVGTHVKVWGR